MKKTAVEWLVEKMSEKNYGAKTYFGANKELVNQAKEMEKQQIIEAYNEVSMNTGEQYYNETFKTKSK